MLPKKLWLIFMGAQLWWLLPKPTPEQRYATKCTLIQFISFIRCSRFVACLLVLTPRICNIIIFGRNWCSGWSSSSVKKRRNFLLPRSFLVKNCFSLLISPPFSSCFTTLKGELFLSLKWQKFWSFKLWTEKFHFCLRQSFLNKIFISSAKLGLFLNTKRSNLWFSVTLAEESVIFTS